MPPGIEPFALVYSNSLNDCTFLLSEIPKKKKSALGVRGMKLSKDDSLTNIYVMAAQNISSIVYKEKELEFHRLKLSKRDSKGTKVRR